MPLEQQLNDLLKQAMKSKDQETLNVLRMLKTRIMERRTAKGFTGEVDDALVTEVISAYRKSMQKAVGEFEAAGQGAGEQAEALRFEVKFCEQFLPKNLDEAALRALIQSRIATLGLKSNKEAGKLLGDVMKSHKGQVDASEVKRIAEEELPKG